MRRLWNAAFKTDQYTDIEQRNQADMVVGITLLVAALYTLYFFFVPSGNIAGETAFEIAQRDIVTLRFVTIFYVVSAAALALTRAGLLEIASWGPMAAWFFGICLNGVQTGFVNAINGILLIALILMGGLLRGNRGLVVGLLAALGALAGGILKRSFLQPHELLPYITSAEDLIVNNASDLLTISLELLGVTGLIYLYLRAVRLSRMKGAVEAVGDRDTTTVILNQITRRVAARDDLNNLLDDIIHRIIEGFPFIYHAQIFLLNDAGTSARLAASTGAVGKRLITRGHSIAVGSVSVIGQVTLQGKPIVARAGSPDSIHRRNESLPDTAVETAFPLRLGDRIIGALDLQSKFVNAFDDPNVVSAFLALADGTALAIDNVSQYENAQERLKENESLVKQAQETLAQVERLNERLTGRAWSEYLRERESDFDLSIDFDGGGFEAEAEDWSPMLREAVRANHLVQENYEDRQVIAVPLRVRGQVVGAMEFELDEARGFSPEDLDLVQQVGERFGLAAENARLVDESQRAAQREALVNQISTRLQSAHNVEGVLNEAARSLRDALKAGKVAIRLGAPPPDSQDGG